jgi:hypothetical protein
VCQRADRLWALIVALLQFLHNRLNIDTERYRPSVTFPTVLTVLSCVAGVMLAIYLVLTGASAAAAPPGPRRPGLDRMSRVEGGERL